MPNGRNINLGEEVITGLSSVKSLTMPSGKYPAEALVTALSKSVRFRFGNDPDANTGHLIAADETVRLIHNLDNVRFIETAASASLVVTYFSGDLGQATGSGV